MSKRTTDSSKPASDAPKTRTRAVRPATGGSTPAAPKAPRTGRKAPANNAAVAKEAATPAVVEPERVVVVERTEVVVTNRTPSHDEIALRAYFISIERGADPLAAWLAAERELTTV